MRKRIGIFWGLFIICAAVMWVLYMVNPWLFAGYTVWHVVVPALLIPMMLDAALNLEAFSFFVPLGLLVWMFQEPLLGVETLAFWPLMGAAVLLSIGGAIVLHPLKKRLGRGYWHAKPRVGKDNWKHHGERWFQDRTEEHLDGEELFFDEKFGESSKYLHSQSLRQVYIRSAFGAMNLYFEDCVLHEGRATVYVDGSFGATRLFVPRGWRVEENVSAFAGAVNYTGRNTAAADAPLLVLEGTAKFGAVEVKFV